MNEQQRYWKWCSISNETEAATLLKTSLESDAEIFDTRKKELVKFIIGDHGLNNILLNDVSLVLTNDMLMKVDAMSMANGLEVRTPFLDYRVVEFAFSIPAEYKTDRKRGKKILYDAFRNFLPEKLYHRRKHGFEVPLHGLLTHELKSKTKDLLSENFIRNQNLLNYESVGQLQRQLTSSNPGDSAARIWGLIALQHWWQKWIL